MRSLTVLYDAQCELCRRARLWLEGQAKYVPLRFVPAGQAEAARLFPELDHEATRKELFVVGDDGAVYRGEKAWIICLWALREYRSTALWLSSRGTLWAAQSLVKAVSKNRHRFFRWRNYP